MREMETALKCIAVWAEFKREKRYIVIKISDLMDVKRAINQEHLYSLDVILEFVEASRRSRGKKPLDCVVVESDWPEYEATWDTIEDRVVKGDEQMNCSCSATSLDGDGYYSARTRKAAKDSTCPECGKTIRKGEEYLFTTLFLDGAIHNSKMCKACESLVDNFFEEGYKFGQIIEDLESYLDNSWIEDLPSNCISKLHPDAKKVVCDILQRYQD